MAGEPAGLEGYRAACCGPVGSVFAEGEAAAWGSRVSYYIPLFYGVFTCSFSFPSYFLFAFGLTACDWRGGGGTYMGRTIAYRRERSRL